MRVATRKTKAEITLTKRFRLLEGKTLKAFGACPQQRRMFTRMFGKSVRVTVKRTVTADAAGLDTAYLSRLMSDKCEIAYERAVDRLWTTGGYAKKQAALKRKFKFGSEEWHNDYDLRTEYYNAEDANDDAFSRECVGLRALYWINDPEPRNEPVY
jgi:hypothetical protein